MSEPDQLPLAGIDVAILVGGLGTRLRGVVNDVPKPLAPVLGRPFLFYQLDMLALRGARSVTLCCGYKADLVRTQVGSEWLGMPVQYSVESEPLGTGGALGLARRFLKSVLVLVLNGDSWLDPNWLALRTACAAKDSASLVFANVPDSGRYGALEISAGRVTAFQEKSTLARPGAINGGVYLLSQEILASLPPGAHSLEREIFPALVTKKCLGAVPAQSPFLDIGIPEDYAAAGDFFAKLGIAPHSMFPDAPPPMAAPPKLGACAIIADDKGRVLLEQRSDCGWWGVPGGAMDASETLAAAAIREAKEETGLDIEITGFIGVFSALKRRVVRYPDNGDLRRLIDTAVTARSVGGHLTASRESLALEWFSVHELPLNTIPPAVEILRQAFARDKQAVLR